MKKAYILLVLVISFWSCEYKIEANQQEEEQAETTEEIKVLPIGTVLLADSMPIPDALNKLQYSVKLVANEYTRQGTYDVVVRYGHNDATTQLTFPRGGTERIIPKMKEGSEPFSYIIGFNYGENDPKFYEYYLVKASSGKIEMNYLKAYSFK